MSKNTSYIRTAPDKREIIINPTTEKEIAYYKSLEQYGYTYRPV